MKRTYISPVTKVIGDDGGVNLLNISDIEARNDQSLFPGVNPVIEAVPTTSDEEYIYNDLSKRHNGEWEDLYETFDW